MRRFFLRIWRIMPGWMQGFASAIIRPHFQVIAAAILINDDGQVMLCEHTYLREHPWGMPGGDIHFGENPEDAVRRELREETGLEVQEARLLLIDSSKQTHKVSLIYQCSGVSGPFIPSDEVARVQYFDPDALPKLSPDQQTIIEKVFSLLNAEKRTPDELA